jgi:AcrR family transcriptional regulator
MDVPDQRPETPPPIIAIDKKARLLEAALGRFQAEGVAAVPVPEIAAAAKVAVGTFYRHFTSKEDLANVLYRLWRTCFWDEVLAPMPPNATPRAALKTTWRRMARFARANPGAMAFLELQPHPWLDEENRALDRRFADTVAAFAAWGRREGQLKPLAPDTLAALLTGALCGLLKALQKPGASPALQDELEDALWNAVAAR